MRRLLARLVLLTALVVGAMAIFGTAPAFAYDQPLNQHESGLMGIIGCAAEMGGSVSGSPIANGDIEAGLFVSCIGGPCFGVVGDVALIDGSDEIDKGISGSLCIVFEGTEGVEYKFKGSYTIVDGSGAYAGATGTGKVSWTFDCPSVLAPLCFFSGTESSAQPEGITPKTGGQPENVLLCSPTL